MIEEEQRMIEEEQSISVTSVKSEAKSTIGMAVTRCAQLTRVEPSIVHATVRGALLLYVWGTHARARAHLPAACVRTWQHLGTYHPIHSLTFLAI